MVPHDIGPPEVVPHDIGQPATSVRPSALQNTGVTFFVVLRRKGPQWDQSRPMEEQSDWPAHASFMDGLVETGFVVLGGPLADEHRVVLVIEADSEDAVRAKLTT